MTATNDAPLGEAADLNPDDAGPGGTPNGINIGRQTVTASTEHLPEAQKSLLRWIYTVARDARWTWKELAEKTGVSTTTFYRVWHNRYTDQDGKPVPLTALCRKLEAYRAEYVKENPAAHVNEYPFIETSIWHRIEWLCTKVSTRKKMGFVYGESHIG